jgi:hypothetical protein
MTQPEPLITQPPTEGEEKLTTIYALVDPRDGKPFYVGKANSKKKRLQYHIREAKIWKEWLDSGADRSSRPSRLSNANKCRVIMEILSTGREPDISTLEECSFAEWGIREEWWRVELSSKGIKLTNIAQCGGGPSHHSEITKEKLRQMGVGRVVSEAGRKKLSESIRASEKKKAADAARRGIKLPPGCRDGAKNPFFGKSHTEESKEKIRVAQKGVPQPDWVREKIGNGLAASPKAQAWFKAMKGRTATGRGAKGMPTTGGAAKGVPKPGVRAYQLGKPKSPEQRAAMILGYAIYNSRLQAAMASGMTIQEARKAVKGKQPKPE